MPEHRRNFIRGGAGLNREVVPCDGAVQVDIHASPEMIKAKFYEKAKRLHPDLNKENKHVEEAKVRRSPWSLQRRLARVIRSMNAEPCLLL